MSWRSRTGALSNGFHAVAIGLLISSLPACSSASRASGTTDADAQVLPDAGGDAGRTTTRIFYLDPGHATVNVVAPDGTLATVLVSGQSATPDGIAVDSVSRHVFWTSMGVPDANDGTLQRADLDGKNPTTVIPSGGTFTPKQLKIDEQHGKLYWSDREGMRVQRSNLDGSELETLVVTGTTDADRTDDTRWCVGIALDLGKRQIYWTQKGPYTSAGGTIRRAGLDLPTSETPDARSDVEVLFGGLISPIDLDLDLGERMIYWTSNGDMTVSRAPMDPPPGVDPSARTDRQILIHNAELAVGIGLDLAAREVYFATSAGISAAGLDGSNARVVLPITNSLLTGLTVAKIPD